MKPPEDIKKGLELCSIGDMRECLKCPYPIGFECFKQPMKDALAYIQQLEAELEDEKNKNEILIFDNDKLMEEIDQAERERDALHNDLELAIYRGSSFNLDCEFCKDKEKPICEDCLWQWRGLCPENTKEDDSGGETTSASDA